MEFDSKQHVLEVLNDLDPVEANRLLPMVTAQYAERIKSTETATAEVTRCKATCDENDAVQKVIAAMQSQKTAELSELEGALRAELRSFRESFALEEQAARIRKLRDAVSYLDSELDHLLRVKRGCDEILFLDALEILALAKSLEAHSAALCSHVSTVALLGPAFEVQGGSLGVIGAKTIQLQTEAALADKRYESAKNAARESRMTYERTQSARVSTGIVTSANVGHTIGR
jgi:hypothetical protein